MANIPSGTKFLGLSSSFPTVEKKSALKNAVQEYYTIEDLAGVVDPNNLIYTVYDNIVTNNTTDSTTTVLDYGVNVIRTSTASDYACKLPQPVTGKKVTVVNKSNQLIKLYPSNVGGQINNYPIDDPAIVPNDGKSYDFICTENPLPGEWTWNAPATGQIEFPVITFNHTNGAISGGFGYSDSTILNSSGASVDGFGNLVLVGNFLTEPVPTTFTKLKVYSNVLSSDLASDLIPDSINVSVVTAYKYASNAANTANRLNAPITHGSWSGSLIAPTGSLSSPTEINDTGTIYSEIDMDMNNGISDQLGTGGLFSRYYYHIGFGIPASAATKDYKFKVYIETYSV